MERSPQTRASIFCSSRRRSRSASLSRAEGRAPAQKDIATFYDSFMQDMLLFGRVYETGLGVLYNMRSMHPFNNMSRLPGLFSRGKLKLRPQRKGASEVKQIAARVKELDRKRS